MAGSANKSAASSALAQRAGEGLTLKSIRPARLVYALAYTFELLFFSYSNYFLQVDTTFFGLDASIPIYVGHYLLSLVVMLLWSKKFRPLIRGSLAVTVLGFAAFLFLPQGIPKLLCAVLTMTGLGGCVTAARCGFAFAANNAERMLGVALALGGRALLNFLDALFPDDGFWDDAIFLYIYPLLTLVGLAVCLLLFRENDMESKEESTPQDSKGLYWALAIFIAFFALDRLLPYMGSNESTPLSASIGGIGKVVALSLFLVCMLLFKKGIWHSWNLFLVITIITAGLAVFAQNPAVDTTLHLFKGIFLTGWVAVLYLLACAQRRFASLKLLKQCTVIFVVISPLTMLADQVALLFIPEYMALFSLGYVLVITIVFLLASPYIYKYLFSAIWISEMQKSDMTLLREKVEEADRFAGYGLTPREKEVTVLLLSANTMRMIAGELKISQSTVNMHTANLYRKLDINSKAELFMKFGVTQAASAKDGHGNL